MYAVLQLQRMHKLLEASWAVLINCTTRSVVQTVQFREYATQERGQYKTSKILIRKHRLSAMTMTVATNLVCSLVHEPILSQQHELCAVLRQRLDQLWTGKDFLQTQLEATWLDVLTLSSARTASAMIMATLHNALHPRIWSVCECVLQHCRRCVCVLNLLRGLVKGNVWIRVTILLDYVHHFYLVGIVNGQHGPHMSAVWSRDVHG